jgi:hypothetical protein
MNWGEKYFQGLVENLKIIFGVPGYDAIPLSQ